MIGVFDSGLGGFSVLAEIARLFPRSDLIYLADTTHVPYGDKSDAFIRGRVPCIGQYFAEQSRQIVVACNTAVAIAAAKGTFRTIPAIACYAVFLSCALIIYIAEHIFFTITPIKRYFSYAGINISSSEVIR